MTELHELPPAEFKGWPKTPRLNRDVIITEKIDGTNAAVGITEITEEQFNRHDWAERGYLAQVTAAGLTQEQPYDQRWFAVYAQSRKRIITPGSDNFGFAQWVYDHMVDLIRDLGPGLHYGEWWGSGIQRGYGLPKGEKRFSLFNTVRYGDREFITPGLATVPVIHTGPFSTESARYWLGVLQKHGSLASMGFMDPEGIILYHTAAGQVFKATIKDDEKPKGQDG